MSLERVNVADEMSDFEKIRRARKELQNRLDGLKEIYGGVMKLSESGGKAEIVEYLSGKMATSPVERGNDVLYGETVVKFDEHGRFLGISEDQQSPSIAVPKHFSGNGEAGDT